MLISDDIDRYIVKITYAYINFIAFDNYNFLFLSLYLTMKHSSYARNSNLDDINDKMLPLSSCIKVDHRKQEDEEEQDKDKYKDL